jgi:predicted metal-binding membrane protein
VKCANPFPFLFANWTERVSGVFRLGLRQGLLCLACCWGLMLVMFAVGTMNVVWIALLTVTMTAEKLVGARWFSRLIGTGLILWAAFVAAAMPIGLT